MRLDKRYKPEATVSPVEGRHNMHHCYLDLADDVLVSTDGMMLTIIPVVPDPEDVTGLIPATAIAGTRKLDKRATAIHITANERIEVPEVLALFERPTGVFPEWRKALPQIELPVKISLDVRKLLAIATALGATEKNAVVELRFSPTPDGANRNEACINVQLHGEDRARGYLMRCMSRR
jgi:hypothetical protein